MRRGLVICAFALLLAPGAADAVPGDIDPTFSRDGYTRIGFGDEYATASAIAVDAQGRIVIAGTTGDERGRYGEQLPAAIGVARFMPNGGLDRSFAGDGTARFEIGASPGVRDIALDSAGRVVIGGAAGGDLVAMRLLADGTLDGTFAGDGLAGADAGRTESGGSLVLGGDGTVTLAGGSCTPGCRFVLARFGADGALDPSFDGDGIVVTSFPGDYAVANDLAVAPGGRLVAAGNNSATYHEAAFARYTADGALDGTFNGGGIAIISGNTQGARAIHLDADGRIVTLGGFGSLYRVTDQAALDTSFARAFLPRAAMTVDARERVVAAGLTGGCYRGCTPVDTIVARASASTGALDTTFGRGDRFYRYAIVDLDAKPDGALAVAVDDQDRPLTAGYSGDRMVVARLESADGPPDMDGDGVDDGPDLCPMRFSKREDGCPRSKRKLTMHRRKRADLWVGRISSREERCNFDQTVRVYRRQPGKDELTSRVASDGDGRWSADGNLRHGQYYARINGYFKERYGFCTKARSNVVRIVR